MASLINWLSSDAIMDCTGCMVEKLWALIGFESLNPLKYPLHSSAGLGPETFTGFKRFLKDVWFTLYSREDGGPKTTSNFEHSFMGEVRNSTRWVVCAVLKLQANFSHSSHDLDGRSLLMVTQTRIMRGTGPGGRVVWGVGLSCDLQVAGSNPVAARSCDPPYHRGFGDWGTNLHRCESHACSILWPWSEIGRVADPTKIANNYYYDQRDTEAILVYLTRTWQDHYFRCNLGI